MERTLLPWFDDAKLGIFVHWTAAAVPAYAPMTADPFNLAAVHGWEHAMAHSPYVEWHQSSLAIEGSPVWKHHRATYGDLPYDAFVEGFLAGHRGWDAAPWADLFSAAGARYVVLVTKHHDGVLLWPSEHPNPHKPAWGSSRDIVGELATAVRDRGIRFGAYYSRPCAPARPPTDQSRGDVEIRRKVLRRPERAPARLAARRLGPRSPRRVRVPARAARGSRRAGPGPASWQWPARSRACGSRRWSR